MMCNVSVEKNSYRKTDSYFAIYSETEGKLGEYSVKNLCFFTFNLGSNTCVMHGD